LTGGSLADRLLYSEQDFPLFFIKVPPRDSARKSLVNKQLALAAFCLGDCGAMINLNALIPPNPV